MIHPSSPSAGPRALMLAPARGRAMTGEAVSFLFSMVQVEDIVSSLPLSRVPLSPGYLDGLSVWRDLLVPVISLEVLFGLAQKPVQYDGKRALVLKDNRNAQGNGKRAVVRLGPGCRLLNGVPKTAPIQADEVLSPEIVPAVKGSFRWENGVIILPDMDRILSGEMNDVFIHRT